MLTASYVGEEFAPIGHVTSIQRRLRQELGVLLPVLVVGDGRLLGRCGDHDILVFVDLAGLLV